MRRGELRRAAMGGYCALVLGCTRSFYDCPPGEHVVEFEYSPGYSGEGCLVGSDGCKPSNRMIRVTWVTETETFGPAADMTDENGCFNSNWFSILAAYHFCTDEDLDEAEFGARLNGGFLVGRLRSVTITLGEGADARSTTLTFENDDLPDYAPWAFNGVDFGTVTIDGLDRCDTFRGQP